MWFKKTKERNTFDKASSLDTMREGAYQTVIAPFNGAEVPVIVRCPNEVQLRACGAFSIIDTRPAAEQAEAAKDRLEDRVLADVVDKQELILKEVLVSPTYEEIVNDVYGTDNWFQTAKKELDEVEIKIRKVKDPSEKQILVTRLRVLKMQIGYLLPNDFTAYIVGWALGIDRSDIRKVTREILLEAAILATRGKDNPSDHIHGNFNDYHKDAINKEAWMLYKEFEDTKKKEKGGIDEIRGGFGQVG
jgi:hypothetical protein